MYTIGGYLGKFIATTGILTIALAYLVVWLRKKRIQRLERYRRLEQERLQRHRNLFKPGKSDHGRIAD